MLFFANRNRVRMLLSPKDVCLSRQIRCVDLLIATAWSNCSFSLYIIPIELSCSIDYNFLVITLELYENSTYRMKIFVYLFLFLLIYYFAFKSSTSRSFRATEWF